MFDPIIKRGIVKVSCWEYGLLIAKRINVVPENNNNIEWCIKYAFIGVK